MRREGRLGPTASAMAAGRMSRAADGSEHVAAGAPPPRASSPSRGNVRSAHRGAAGEPTPTRGRATTPLRGRNPSSDVKRITTPGGASAQTTPAPRRGASPAKRTPTPASTAGGARGASPMPSAQRRAPSPAQRRSPSPGAKKAAAQERDATDARARQGLAARESLRATPQAGRKSPLRRRSPQAPADSGAGPSSNFTPSSDGLEAKPAKPSSTFVRSSPAFSTPTTSKARMGNDSAARQSRPSQKPPPGARRPSPPRSRVQQTPQREQREPISRPAAPRSRPPAVEEKGLAELSIPIGQDLAEALTQINSRDGKASAASASDMGMSELSTPSFIVDQATFSVNDAGATLDHPFALNIADFAISGKLKDPGPVPNLSWDSQFATENFPAPKGLPAEFRPTTGFNDMDASARTTEVPAPCSQGEPAPEPTEPPPSPMDDRHEGVTEEDREHAAEQFKDLFGALQAFDDLDAVATNSQAEGPAPELSPPAVTTSEVMVPGIAISSEVTSQFSPPTICCPPSARNHHILTQSDSVITLGRQQSPEAVEQQSSLGDTHYRFQLPPPSDSGRGTGAILKAAASLRREAQELGKAIEVWAELNTEPGGCLLSDNFAGAAPVVDVAKRSVRQSDTKQMEAAEIAAELERLRTGYATHSSGHLLGTTGGSSSSFAAAPPAQPPESAEFFPPAACATAMDAAGGDQAPAMPSGSMLYHSSGLPLLAQAPAQAQLSQAAMQPYFAAACAGLASDLQALQAWPTHGLASARNLAMQQLLAGGNPSVNPQLAAAGGAGGWLPLGLGASASSSSLDRGSTRQALDVRLQSPDLGAAFGTPAAGAKIDAKPDQSPTLLCSPSLLHNATSPAVATLFAGQHGMSMGLSSSSAAPLHQRPTRTADMLTSSLASSTSGAFAAQAEFGSEAQEASLSPPPCRPLPRDWRGACPDITAGFGDMTTLLGKQETGGLAPGSFSAELPDSHFQFHMSSEGKPISDNVVTKEKRVDWECHFASRGFGTSTAAATAATGPSSSGHYSALGAMLGPWGTPGLTAPPTTPPTSLQPPWS